MERILVYALTENIGGVEEYVLNLIRYKRSDNIYGYVVLGESTPYQDEIEKLGCKCFFLPKKRQLINSIIKTRKLFKSLRREYDCIYFNTSALGYIIPYLYAIKYNYKIVLHSHSDARKTAGIIKKIVHRVNYSIIKNKVSVKLACSSPAANWMFGNQYENVQIIPNAIDLHRFRYDAQKRSEIRKQLNIDKSTIVLGNIGRLTKVKNQEFLLELVKEFKQQKKSVRLVLVGDGKDYEKLHRIVEQNDLIDYVTFWGRTERPEEVMNGLDCIVMPSLAEGFPISLIEAQAAGLPCVVSDCITEEVNVSGCIQFLSLNASIQEWYNAIIQLAKMDRKDNIQLLDDNGYEVQKLEKLVSSII